MNEIRITQRAEDWIACFADTPGDWEAGASPEEALGKLVISHAARFGAVLGYASRLTERAACVPRVPKRIPVHVIHTETDPEEAAGWFAFTERLRGTGQEKEESHADRPDTL